MNGLQTENKPGAVGTSGSATASATEPSVITFEDALPGIEGITSWQLIEVTEARPFFWLRSADPEPCSLLVVDPRVILSDYAPRFSGAALDRIGLTPEGQGDAGHGGLVLVTVTIEQDGNAFANLRAPIVINPHKMLGSQLILDDVTLPLAHPLVAPVDDAGACGTRRSLECSSSAEERVSR